MAFLSLLCRFPILIASPASGLLSLCFHPPRTRARYSFTNVIAQGLLLAHSAILIHGLIFFLLLTSWRRYRDAKEIPPVTHLQSWILNPTHQISEGENTCSALSSLQMRRWQGQGSYTWIPGAPRKGIRSCWTPYSSPASVDLSQKVPGKEMCQGAGFVFSNVFTWFSMGMAYYHTWSWNVFKELFKRKFLMIRNYAAFLLYPWRLVLQKLSSLRE